MKKMPGIRPEGVKIAPMEMEDSSVEIVDEAFEASRGEEPTPEELGMDDMPHKKHDAAPAEPRTFDISANFAVTENPEDNSHVLKYTGGKKFEDYFDKIKSVYVDSEEICIKDLENVEGTASDVKNMIIITYDSSFPRTDYGGANLPKQITMVMQSTLDERGAPVVNELLDETLVIAYGLAKRIGLNHIVTVDEFVSPDDITSSRSSITGEFNIHRSNTGILSI